MDDKVVFPDPSSASEAPEAAAGASTTAAAPADAAAAEAVEAAARGSLGSKSSFVKSPRAIQLSSTFLSRSLVSLDPSLQYAIVWGIRRAKRAAKTLPSSVFIFSNPRTMASMA